MKQTGYAADAAYPVFNCGLGWVDLGKSIDEYRPVFRKVFTFMEKHLNAATDDGFLCLADDLGQFASPFELELLAAVVNELERGYTDRGRDISRR